MSKLKAWLSSLNISSHTIAGLALSLGGLYISNSEVKAVVDAFLTQHKNLSAVFTVAIAAYLKYSRGRKPAQDSESTSIQDERKEHGI